MKKKTHYNVPLFQLRAYRYKVIFVALTVTFCLYASCLFTSAAQATDRWPVLAAIIQYRVRDLDAVGRDADRVEAFVRQAAANGAKIVVTPETTFYRFSVGVQNGVTQLDLANNYSSLVSRFSNLSKELGISLVIGLRKPSGDPILPTYNVAVFFGPDGNILGTHRKVIPATNETAFTKSGDQSDLNVFMTPYGKTGMLICKDMDVYWPSQALVSQGMKLLIGISADPGVGGPGRGWQKVYPACAQGGVCYGIGANQIGTNIDDKTNGGSGFVAPGGHRLSAAGFNGVPNDERILYETLYLPDANHVADLSGPLFLLLRH